MCVYLCVCVCGLSWTEFFEAHLLSPLKNLATLGTEKLQGFHGLSLYHCYYTLTCPWTSCVCWPALGAAQEWRNRTPNATNWFLPCHEYCYCTNRTTKDMTGSNKLVYHIKMVNRFKKVLWESPALGVWGGNGSYWFVLKSLRFLYMSVGPQPKRVRLINQPTGTCGLDSSLSKRVGSRLVHAFDSHGHKMGGIFISDSVKGGTHWLSRFSLYHH